MERHISMALGSIIVITPILGWSWPALTPLIAAAAATLGYTQLSTAKTKGKAAGVLGKVLAKHRTAILALDELLVEPVADEVGRERMLVFERDEIQVVFRRDVRGKFQVEVSGPEDYTLAQLKAMGHEFAITLIRQFAHNRVVQEMERRGMIIVDEEINEEGDIVVRTKRWS